MEVFMNNSIQQKFDDISQNYDKQRKVLIPCFDDFYNSAISLIETSKQKLKVLDIGGGTGLFSMFLLNKYPEASITIIDISEKMLDIARLRFRDNPNIKYLVEDYTEYNFTEKYDVIISALSIHHLTHEQKEAMYKKCYYMLNSEGIFINADQVLGNTAYTEDFNKRAWKNFIENSGLTKEELNATYERIKLDKEAKLDEQLKWLAEVGFADVECVYKYYHFAVMFGRKID
jgi:tRNA (cmo5U34)-methyltransferase